MSRTMAVAFMLAFCSAFLLPGTGTAQSTWEKYGRPVLTVGSAGDWDSKQVVLPAVVSDNALYHMWYSGHDGESWKIGYAQSPDGILWEKASPPVLDRGPAGAWDDNVVYGASIILDNTTFKMWYSAGDNASKISHIGYATSHDGITWTKYPQNPVMRAGSPGEWDNASVYHPWVIKSGNTFKMWFNGYRGAPDTTKIGYAESDDGISWTKYDNNPVVVPGEKGSWDANLVRPTVVYDGSIYHMWYAGYHEAFLDIGFFNILYATSADGMQWEKYSGNPVLKHALRLFTSWEGRSILYPAVILNGSEYKMWYVGQGGWGKAQRFRIGLATSQAEEK